MKKTILLTGFLISFSFSFSQSLAYDSVDIANINARISVIGNHFWDMNGESKFIVPKGSRKTSIFNNTIWMGGKDEDSLLRLAGERYRQTNPPNVNPDKGDYYPGPLTINGGLLLPSVEIQYNRIWKLTSAEIEYHKYHWSSVGYIPPVDILEWPGNGDTSIFLSKKLAPFYDKNNNDLYEPMLGDYPLIRGDQCLFFIFNDAGMHYETKGTPIKTEIHGMAYAFDCMQDSAFKNSIFLHYDIINRNTINFNKFYYGFFTDLDIGYGFDDYIGCDTLLNSYYAYNGKNIDGTGQYWAYGKFPPAQSVTFLNNINYNNTHTSNFIIFNNTGNGPWAMQDPEIASEYFSFLNTNWKDSTHLTYWEPFHGTQGLANFEYPGNIYGDSNEWTEGNLHNLPYDRRGLGSFGPTVFKSNGVLSIDCAFIFARDFNDSTSRSVGLLKQYISKVRHYFEVDSTPCGRSFSQIKTSPKTPITNSVLSVYPNPAINSLFIKENNINRSNYSIYNSLGKLVLHGKVSNDNNYEIDVANLSIGMYIIKVENGSEILTAKFIKK